MSTGILRIHVIEHRCRIIASLHSQSPVNLEVPDTLITLYKFMVDDASAKAIDSEITRMCAFSLPAVAWAVGRRHWYLIRDILTTLAASDDVSVPKLKFLLYF